MQSSEFNVMSHAQSLVLYFIQFKAMRLAVAASLRDFCDFSAEVALDHIRLLQNGLSDPLPEVLYLYDMCFLSLSLILIYPPDMLIVLLIPW